tara:strand:- start:14 stop:1930 length:1917 start_codon:yes stop_codon:yes gene_type:complete
MARNITMNQLTEGIRDRHLGAERNRLVEKWTRTGLLRGMADQHRETMSQLLENQAAQLLREANVLGSSTGADSGAVDGFSNIAFPIVRRVFGGLIANDLVSIQPMSLPSGLLFYLDYTYGTDVGGDTNADTGAKSFAATYTSGESLYNGPAGAGVRTGSNATGGQYDLVGTAYSKVHGRDSVLPADILATGSFSGGSSQSFSEGGILCTSGADGKLIQFDPQISNLIDNESGRFSLVLIGTDGLQSLIAKQNSARPDPTQVKSISLYTAVGERASVGPFDLVSSIQEGDALNVRRLNTLGTWDSSANKFTVDPFAAIDGSTTALLTVVSGAWTPVGDQCLLSASFAIGDSVAAAGGTGGTLTIPSFESDFDSTPQPVIPEIDIKIESIAVTAQTRKLRARWSPELAQDLNAYHSLDAEVELTQILSEQIALEIDREILNDLLVEARGANYYWSRMPGKFVNKKNGSSQELASTLATGPQFTGTVREWYETLVETIIDVANEIHRKTLRGSANFLVCSPEVATIFEASVLYKPSIKLDGQGQAGPEFSIGASAIGSLSNRFTVYKDPYFPRNKILVGYKGGSYLETGYVYAPYVPLIVTPTIFAPEDFTPRKGVMTRYGKKMVRADFYGTVTCLDMDII